MRQKTKGQLKKELWKWFSLYIRQRDKGICFTCGRKAEGSGYHASHFIPKSVGGLALYFHEDNVKGCCYNCNINLGGNQWEFGQRLGKKKVNELMKLKQKIIKDFPYQARIDYYKSLVNNSQPLKYGYK